MNTPKLLSFLKQHHLLGEAKKASLRMEKVFTQCLQADLEDIHIIADYGKEGSMLSAILGAGYYLAAKELDLNPILWMQNLKFKGERAAEHVEAMLDDSGYGNILMLVANSLGTTPAIGKSFRKFAKSRNHKFISCTGLSCLENRRLKPVLDAIDIDYRKLRGRGLSLKRILDRGREVHVTTKAGTDFWMKIARKESHSNDGFYSDKGTGGNLPSGEVYIAPRKKKVDGKVVVDGSSRTIKGTNIVKRPMTLEVEGGEVTGIKGGEEAKILERSLEWAIQRSRHPWGIRRLSEFGIGINPKARIIGAMIVDEKTHGTAHVAMGSNHWFGGTVYAITHLDNVFKNPEIRVDGELLDKSLYT